MNYRRRIAVIGGALAFVIGGFAIRADEPNEQPAGCGGPCPTYETTTTESTTTTTIPRGQFSVPVDSTIADVPPSTGASTTTATTGTTSTTTSTTSTSTTTTTTAPVITAINGPAIVVTIPPTVTRTPTTVNQPNTGGLPVTR